MGSHAPQRPTGSYGYNYTCPVCGQVWKFKDCKLRWDGIYVCPPDWEPRHVRDFFRVLPDSHVLPRTAADIVNTAATSMDGVTGGWTPSWTHILTTGTLNQGDYKDDTLSITHTRTFKVQLKQTFGQSTQFHTGGFSSSLSLPSTPVSNGTYTLMTDQGTLIQSGTIIAPSPTVNVVGSPLVVDHTIIFSGKYGI